MLDLHTTEPYETCCLTTSSWNPTKPRLAAFMDRKANFAIAMAWTSPVVLAHVQGWEDSPHLPRLRGYGGSCKGDCGEAAIHRAGHQMPIPGSSLIPATWFDCFEASPLGLGSLNFSKGQPNTTRATQHPALTPKLPAVAKQQLHDWRQQNP